jgi:tetratricopeptide (TPR) repeat protein
MPYSDAERHRGALVRARQLLRERRYLDAYQVCKDELARDRGEPQLLLIAAHSQLARGRYEDAARHAQQALQLDQGIAEAHRILADVACHRRDLEVAGHHLERVTTIDPHDTVAARLHEKVSSSSAAGRLGSSHSGLTPLIEDSERASSVGRFLGMGDSRELGVGEDLMSKRKPNEAGPSHDDVLGWIPDQAPPKPEDRPPVELSGLSDSEEDDEDAPTMPLLRPSKKKPDLHLDPLSSEPVSVSVHAKSAAAPINTQPLAPSQILSAEEASESTFEPAASFGDPDEGDDYFDEANIEPASIPVKRQQRSIQKARDPLMARKEHQAERQKAQRAPKTSAEPNEPPGSLMAMLAGEAPRDDDSLSDFVAKGPAEFGDSSPSPVDSLGDSSPPRKTKKKATRSAPKSEAWDPLAEMDEMDDEPASSDGGGWDPLAEMEADEPARKPARKPAPAADAWDPLGDDGFIAEPDDDDMPQRVMSDEFDSDFLAGGLGKTKRSRKGLWIGLVIFLLLAAGGGGFGYFYIQNQKAIAALWKDFRAQIAKGTPKGFAAALKTSQMLLEKRAKDPKAQAAVAMCHAAISVELGQDQRADAKKALAKTGTKDSEWKTATRGFLALGKDPAGAVGYLQKGAELYPKSPTLHYLLGRALAATGQGQNALAAYKKALSSGSYLPAAVAAAELVGRADFPQGEKLLADTVKTDPSHVAALIARARLRIHHGRDVAAVITDMTRVTTELAAMSSAGQKGWAALLLAQAQRQRNQQLAASRAPAGSLGETIKALDKALDEAAKTAPCCNPHFGYELAGELASRYRFHEALQRIKEAVKLRGKDKAVRQRAARILLALGLAGRAKQHLAAVGGSDALSQLLAAEANLLSGKITQAKASAQALAANKKLRLRAELLLARADMLAGKHRKASGRLYKLAKRYKTPVVLIVRGRLALAQNKLDKAEAWLKNAWRLDSLDPRTPTLLAETSLLKGDLKRARSRLERALSIRPDFAPAHFALARVKLLSGNPGAAKNQLEKVPAASRERPDYALVSAEIALAENDLAAAKTAISTAKNAGLSGWRVSRLLGELAYRAGEPAKAVELLKQAKKGAPKASLQLLLMLGKAQLQAKQGDDGYNTLRDALDLDPENIPILLALGNLAISDKDIPKAIKRLSTALEVTKKRPQPPAIKAKILAALGKVYLNKGDAARALINLQEAAELAPNNASAQLLAGRVLDQLDRPEKAIKHYTLAMASFAKSKKTTKLSRTLERLAKAQVKAKRFTAAAQSYKQLAALAPKGPNARMFRREARRLLRKAKKQR